MPQRVPVLALSLLLITFDALAQSGPTLLLEPWPKEKFLEFSADAILQSTGETEDTNEDVRIHTYESTGRLRLFPGNVASPRIGHDFTFLDISTDDPRIPDQLTDQALSVGLAFAQFDGWIAGITAGAGYAADSAYDDANAFYGKATLIFGKEFNKNHAWAIVLDYDGNRTIFPDVPLPGVAYSFKVPEREFEFVVGFPVNSVLWRPNDQWRLEATYTVTDRFDARVGYAFAREWNLFGRFETRFNAFHLEELEEDNDRLFFSQRRAEVGIQWTPRESLGFTIAGGYAFAQEFAVGFDYRDLEHVNELSDEPYLRLGLELRF